MRFNILNPLDWVLKVYVLFGMELNLQEGNGAYEFSKIVFLKSTRWKISCIDFKLSGKTCKDNFKSLWCFVFRTVRYRYFDDFCGLDIRVFEQVDP